MLPLGTLQINHHTFKHVCTGLVWLNVWLNVWLKDVTLRKKTVQASVWLSHAAQEICETAQDVVAVKRITCIRLEKFSRTPQGVVAVRHTP